MIGVCENCFDNGMALYETAEGLLCSYCTSIGAEFTELEEHDAFVEQLQKVESC